MSPDVCYRMVTLKRAYLHYYEGLFYEVTSKMWCLTATEVKNRAWHKNHFHGILSVFCSALLVAV